MDAQSLMWLIAGVMAGVLHATLLWKASHRLSAWTPIVGFARLLGVAVLLVAAALAGGVVPAAAGWAIGFALSALLAVGRRRQA